MISNQSERGSLVDTLIARRGVGAAASQVASALREVALLVAGVALLALSAHVIIPLPYTPVPVTGQTFGVLLLAAAYGIRRGLATVALYLFVGAAGLPVFASGASIASYGYLAGFALAAIVVGWLADHGWGRTLPSAIAAMLAGEVAIYACGLVWLSRFVGWGNVYAMGLHPFLIGDGYKLVAAALLLPAAWLVTRRTPGQETRNNGR